MNALFFILTVIATYCSTTSATYTYNEDLTKNKLLQLSAGAYSTYPKLCVNHIFSNANVTFTYTGNCGKNWGEWRVCNGYVGVSHDEEAIFLVYR